MKENYYCQTCGKNISLEGLDYFLLSSLSPTFKVMVSHQSFKGNTDWVEKFKLHECLNNSFPVHRFFQSEEGFEELKKTTRLKLQSLSKYEVKFIIKKNSEARENLKKAKEKYLGWISDEVLTLDKISQIEKSIGFCSPPSDLNKGIEVFKKVKNLKDLHLYFLLFSKREFEFQSHFKLNFACDYEHLAISDLDRISVYELKSGLNLKITYTKYTNAFTLSSASNLLVFQNLQKSLRLLDITTNIFKDLPYKNIASIIKLSNNCKYIGALDNNGILTGFTIPKQYDNGDIKTLGSKVELFVVTDNAQFICSHKNVIINWNFLKDKKTQYNKISQINALALLKDKRLLVSDDSELNILDSKSMNAIFRLSTSHKFFLSRNRKFLLFDDYQVFDIDTLQMTQALYRNPQSDLKLLFNNSSYYCSKSITELDYFKYFKGIDYFIEITWKFVQIRLDYRNESLKTGYLIRGNLVYELKSQPGADCSLFIYDIEGSFRSIGLSFNIFNMFFDKPENILLLQMDRNLLVWDIDKENITTFSQFDYAYKCFQKIIRSQSKDYCVLQKSLTKCIVIKSKYYSIKTLANFIQSPQVSHSKHFVFYFENIYFKYFDTKSTSENKIKIDIKFIYYEVTKNDKLILFSEKEAQIYNLENRMLESRHIMEIALKEEILGIEYDSDLIVILKNKIILFINDFSEHFSFPNKCNYEKQLFRLKINKRYLIINLVASPEDKKRKKITGLYIFDTDKRFLFNPTDSFYDNNEEIIIKTYRNSLFIKTTNQFHIIKLEKEFEKYDFSLKKYQFIKCSNKGQHIIFTDGGYTKILNIETMQTEVIEFFKLKETDKIKFSPDGKVLFIIRSMDFFFLNIPAGTLYKKTFLEIDRMSSAKFLNESLLLISNYVSQFRILDMASSNYKRVSLLLSTKSSINKINKIDILNYIAFTAGNTVFIINSSTKEVVRISDIEFSTIVDTLEKKFIICSEQEHAGTFNLDNGRMIDRIPIPGEILCISKKDESRFIISCDAKAKKLMLIDIPLPDSSV